MGMLEGQTVFLSGVGEGLGRDAALLFAREGADLVITARRPDIIESIAAEVRQLGRKCLPVVCDITKLDDCERSTHAAIERFGKIDTLVNIAYVTDWPKRLTLLESEPDLSNYRGCFEVNVFATLQMTRLVAKHMVERRAGRIVMINTMTAEKVYPGSEGYSGSKIALQRMTRAVAMELGEYGIRVNSMHPGFMWGPQVEKVMNLRAIQNGTTPEQELKKVTDQAALRYVPPTEEYARTLLFFASSLSDAVTGQSLHVNGGLYFH
ncbi:SDR family oxidoreductase [Noviherbaspirillum sedimenti]|uniref:SDR family oxidoreductase n=1 Tax=Noviherbaspirillum sedimenti TaxID=2320865 RepID=A0A3A3GI84_9BURK|nr:SDR family oxidoreductase [Noviherbaspirillum sedimenti]RJG00610.1 SDR family oxidoreductase [Noviherbaspirillum sedimenti]